jgi:hypothetical protein
MENMEQIMRKNAENLTNSLKDLIHRCSVPIRKNELKLLNGLDRNYQNVAISRLS